MAASLLVASVTLTVIVAAMIVETLISRRHERALRACGAVEPQRDVYALMQVAYPISFVAMAVEGGLFGIAAPTVWTWGAVLFLVAKLLKYWAMFSLGSRWTFRVLVPVGAPLVHRGPYRWVAHPNYIAVFGELAGTALMMASVVTGALALAGFGVLIAQRITVESRALGRTS